MRFSQANEERQRASNHQPSSSNRSQATLCVKGNFPRQCRLQNRDEFRRISRLGHRFKGVFLSFLFIKEIFNQSRLGITASKQFGSAVCRNLLKRRVREAFRLQRHQFPHAISLNVAPLRKGYTPSLKEVQADFRLLLTHLEESR